MNEVVSGAAHAAGCCASLPPHPVQARSPRFATRHRVDSSQHVCALRERTAASYPATRRSESCRLLSAPHPVKRHPPDFRPMFMSFGRRMWVTCVDPCRSDAGRIGRRGGGSARGRGRTARETQGTRGNPRSTRSGMNRAPWRVDPSRRRTARGPREAHFRAREPRLTARDADFRAREAHFRAREAHFRAREAHFRAREADFRRWKVISTASEVHSMS